ncbi:MAG: penicillin-binding protein activator [Proteobacteria bacterium]|nr:penicillin-binding protein activator [Pseudomonadota bacterium]
MRVYTKTRFTACLQILFAVFTVFLLSSCGTSYPWGTAVNTGVVTNNPDSIPNIAWQTQGQRQELVQQNNIFSSHEEMTQPSVTPALTPAPEAAAPVMPSHKVAVSLLLPLSGKKADLGQSMLKAAQMALFDIGSANFELIPRDTKSTSEGAAAAAIESVRTHADLILGPIFAEDLKAVKLAVSGSGIPIISFTTDWTLAGDNTYIMGFLPFIQVARVAKYAQAKGYTRFAVFAPQSEYCDVVIRTLQSSGVLVVHVNRYASKQPDLSTLVQDFASTSKSAFSPNQLDFDVLMLPLGSEGLRTLLTSLDASGISQPNVRFIGTGLWDDVGLTTNPSLFGGWFAAPDPLLRTDFERRFQENFGVFPMRLSSLAYDATALAAVLARAAQSATSPYTHEALINPRGFAGIDGIFRFRPDGLSERGLAVLEIQSGKTVVMDPAPTAFIPPGS